MLGSVGQKLVEEAVDVDEFKLPACGDGLEGLGQPCLYGSCRSFKAGVSVGRFQLDAEAAVLVRADQVIFTSPIPTGSERPWASSSRANVHWTT